MNENIKRIRINRAVEFFWTHTIEVVIRNFQVEDYMDENFFKSQFQCVGAEVDILNLRFESIFIL